MSFHDLWPCLSCPAWRRGSMVWRPWPSQRRQSYRRWSWWVAPSDYRWPLRTHSGRCRHLHHELTHQSQRYIHYNQLLRLSKIIIKGSYSNVGKELLLLWEGFPLPWITYTLCHSYNHPLSSCSTLCGPSSYQQPPPSPLQPHHDDQNYLNYMLTSFLCLRTSARWPCWDLVARGGGRCPEPDRGWNCQRIPWC